MNRSDPYDLDRFVAAQNGVLARVREELAAGRKQTHWMWFVFPQILGLGRSATSAHYAIRSVAEAVAYLEHPRLGPCLVDCTRLVNEVKGRTVSEIFGTPDDLKFHSSMTLFALAQSDELVFEKALLQFFDGTKDTATVRLLKP